MNDKMLKELERLIDWKHFYPKGASVDFLDKYKEKLNMGKLFVEREEYQTVNNLVRYKDYLDEYYSEDRENKAIDKMLSVVKVSSNSEYDLLWNTFGKTNYSALAKRNDFPDKFPVENKSFSAEEALDMLPDIPAHLIDEHLLFLGKNTQFMQYYRDKLTPAQVIKLADNNVSLRKLAVFQQIPFDYLVENYKKFPIQDIYKFQDLSSEQYFKLVDVTGKESESAMRTRIKFTLDDLIKFFKERKYSTYEISRYGFRKDTARELFLLGDYKHLLSLGLDELIYEVPAWNEIPDECLPSLFDYTSHEHLFEIFDNYSYAVPEDYVDKVKDMYASEYSEYLNQKQDSYDYWDLYDDDY